MNEDNSLEEYYRCRDLSIRTVIKPIYLKTESEQLLKIGYIYSTEDRLDRYFVEIYE